MKKLLLVLPVFFVLLSVNSFAQIYNYTTSTSGSPSSVDPNATGSSLTRVNGAAAPGSPCGTGFTSNNFSSTTTFSTSLAAVSATLTPNSGYELSITGFSVALRRSGTGPSSVRLAYSLDGGSTWTDKGSNDAPNNGSCGSTATATWTTSVTVTSSASGIIFRVYGFSASGTSGNLQVLNLKINGSVVSATGTTPGITGNPSDVTTCSGTTTSFTATDTGSPAPTLQWQRSTTGASGTFVNITSGMDGGIYGSSYTSNTLTVTSPSTSVSGYAYKMVATNASGTATSSAATLTVTASPVVGAISGAGGLCGGGTETLSDTTTGGTWTSSDGTVATIGSDGTVSAVGPGTATITYSKTVGSCTGTATASVTVGTMPGSVSITPSAATLCPSSPAQLLAASGGTIDGPLAVSSGSISVSASSGTAAISSLAVSGIPTGATITNVSVKFTASQSGGAWDSDDIFNLKAPDGNILNLVDAKGGSSSTGGFTNTVISSGSTTAVPATGAPYTGTYAADAVNGIGFTGYTSNVTTWSSMTTTPNGTWQLIGDYTYSSGTTTITSWTLTIDYTYQAPITWAGTTGLYTDAGASTAYTGGTAMSVYALPSATTTYTATATYGGCTTSTPVTVNVNSSLYIPAISGETDVCAGANIVLTDSTTGGTWASSDTTIARIDASTGVVTGVAAGDVTITYLYSSGSCSGSVTHPVHVHALPVMGTITGGNSVCIGSPVTLSETPAGGAWSSSNASVATVDASTGEVTGVSPGVVTITYSYSDGTCSNTATNIDTINYTPTALSVTPSSVTICTGSTPQMLVVTGGGIVSGVAGAGTTSAVSFSSGTVGLSPVTVSGIPSGASVTSVYVTFNVTQSGGSWDADDIINLEAPNGNILNLVKNKGGSGSSSGFVNTVISSGSTTAVPATGAPYTGTYMADAASGVGYSGYLSDVTTWSNMTDIPNGTWTLIGDDTYTAGAPAISSWSITINYDYQAATTWSPATGLFTDAAGTIPYTGTSADTVYAMPGSTTTYSVTATNGACTSSQDITVTVNPMPTTSPSNDGPVCETGTIHLHANATGATTYSWSGPGGFTSTDADPVITGVTAADTGTYTVTVSAAGAGCTATGTTNVSISPLPTISPSNDGPVCAGGTLHLFSDATGVTSYSWSGPDGFSSTDANPILTGVTADESGAYYLTVAGAASSCGVTGETDVTINPLPAAGTITGASSVCVGAMVTLSDTATGGTWSSGDTTVATVSSSGIVTAIAAGTTTISYTVANVCDTASVSVPFTVHPDTSAGISGDTLICTGGGATTVTFNSAAYDTVHYTIDGSGSFSAVLDASGAYTVSSTLPAGTTTYILQSIGSHGCSSLSAPDTLNISSINGGTWLGNSSTDWNDGANWSCGAVPSGSVTVTIPSGTSYSPVISSGTANCDSISVAFGATLTVSSGAALNVGGELSNDGTIAGDGLVSLDGSVAQTITGTGPISNLELNNTAGASVYADTLHLMNTLTLTTGTLHTNDLLLLVSNESGTARIGEITGGGITGNVTCQQYIAVPGSDTNRRAYRFFSHPFSTSLDMNALQDDIDITGRGGSANGFTDTYTDNPSAFYYNTYTGDGSTTDDVPGWKAFTNTTTDGTDSTTWYQYEGIRVLVRGVKGIGLWGETYTPAPVTIDFSGPVNTGMQTIPMRMGSGSAYNLLGNPYPSPVDIGTIINNGSMGGAVAGPAYWVWNPYDAIQGAYETVPIDGVQWYLPSYSAFEVEAAYDGATLTFNESDKGNDASATLGKTTATANYVLLHIYDTTYRTWDKLYIRFNTAASDTWEKAHDAGKLHNSNLDFYSYSSDGRRLCFDARPYVSGNVIPLGIGTNVLQHYIMKADACDVPSGGQLYLHDKYLETYTLLSEGAVYPFTISSDTMSQGNRFELSMQGDLGVAATKAQLQVSITPNPAKDKVMITYSIPGGKCKISVANAAGQQVYAKDLGDQPTGSATIDMTAMPAGIYFVNFINGEKINTQKLIKE